LLAADSNTARFHSLALLFIAVVTTGILYQFYWIFLLPVALAAVMLAFLSLDKLMLITVVATPLSINLTETPLGIGVSLPAEPMMFGIMLLFFLKLLLDGRLDKRIMRHPVSILIYLSIGWMIVTTVTSTMFLVSLKSTIARIWFVTVYYFLAAHVFAEFENIRKFIWLYLLALLVVIGYTLFGFVAGGMTEKIAHVCMTPFYNDHTAYGAALAMFLPPVIAMIFDSRSSIAERILTFLVFAILILALVFSYTRAAWVSIAGMAFCYLIFLFRVHTRIVFAVAAVVLIYILFSWTEIIIRLESNTERSSTDYREHLGSIANISTDASNVERVNRWLCALRMFNEKKFFGFGPGTYQFQYGKFQHNDEKTIISTNFGTVGSSHSEYLGPLSEQGLPGMILFMVLLLLVIIYASKYIIRSDNKQGKLFAKGILLGLTTYFIHGLLNFFLDTDKASVPFWGFIAALTALQVYHFKEKSA